MKSDRPRFRRGSLDAILLLIGLGFGASALEGSGELDGIGGDGKGDNGADDADQQEGEDIPLEVGVILHNGHPGGDEQQGHILLEKADKALNLFLADPAEQQEEKEEDHADDAGRKGEGEQVDNPLAEEADEEDKGSL